MAKVKQKIKIRTRKAGAGTKICNICHGTGRVKVKK